MPLTNALEVLNDPVVPLVLLALAGWVCDRSARSWSGGYAWVWLWPATFAHELAHYLMAHLCRARPRGLDLWPGPPEADGRRQLGSVTFEQHWASAGLVALAPLGLLVGLALLGLHWRPAAFLAGLWAYGLFPSAQDWQVALTNPIIPALAVLALSIGFS